LQNLLPPLAQFPLRKDRKILFRKNRVRKLYRTKKRKGMLWILSKTKYSYALKRCGKGHVIVREDNGRKAFAMNKAAMGFRKETFNHQGLVFLAFVVTVGGGNPAVVRQLDFLFSYLHSGKPHGFLKHLRQVCKLCWLLS
jgi:uncharacterized pyridoxamine 5'-phosphate oxidase family protein